MAEVMVGYFIQMKGNSIDPANKIILTTCKSMVSIILEQQDIFSRFDIVFVRSNIIIARLVPNPRQCFSSLLQDSL